MQNSSWRACRKIWRAKNYKIVALSGDSSLSLDAALSAIYQTLGASLENIAHILPGEAGKITEQAMVAEGLARTLGFPEHKLMHLTTRFLDPDFDANTTAQALIARMRLAGQTPVRHKDLVSTLEIMKGYAEFEGAMHPTLTPQEYIPADDDIADERP